MADQPLGARSLVGMLKGSYVRVTHPGSPGLVAIQGKCVAVENPHGQRLDFELEGETQCHYLSVIVNQVHTGRKNVTIEGVVNGLATAKRCIEIIS